jgi:hypothetical protein
MGYAILRELNTTAILGDDDGGLILVSKEFLEESDSALWKDGPSVIHTTAARLIVPHTDPTRIWRSAHFPGLVMELDQPVATEWKPETIELAQRLVGNDTTICCGYSAVARLWVVKDDE